MFIGTIMATASRLGHLVRQFSTTSACQKLVQPKLKVFGLEGRYATALYSAASKQSKLEQVDKELASLKDILGRDQKFKDFLVNPTIQKSERKEMLDSVIKSQKLSDLTANLFMVMMENKRLKHFEGVIGTFLKLMRVERGEVECVITSAKTLDQASVKEITTILNGFKKPGENFIVEWKVNPDLMGGLTVSIGDKFVDMSIASKVKTYYALIDQPM